MVTRPELREHTEPEVLVTELAETTEPQDTGTQSLSATIRIILHIRIGSKRLRVARWSPALTTDGFGAVYEHVGKGKQSAVACNGADPRGR